MRLFRACVVSGALCVAALWQATFAPPAAAVIVASWAQVPISGAAIADDPQLADMICLEFYATTTGNWTAAGLRVTLNPGASFYQHPVGGDTRPAPALVSVLPALAYDTFVTAPSDTGTSGAPLLLSGFPEGQPPSFGGAGDPLPGVFSVSWGDFTVDPPGNYLLARLTFPGSSSFSIHPLSTALQANPEGQSFWIPEPCAPTAIIALPALLAQRRRRWVKGSRPAALRTRRPRWSR